MDSFEYKNVVIGGAFHRDPTQADKQLTALGSDGWELVSVSPVMMKEGFIVLFTFKRSTDLTQESPH